MTTAADFPEHAPSPPPGEGETRDCLDPWFQPFIQPNGKVWPCCWFYEDLGNVHDTPFDELINTQPFKDLRRELLTGRLRPACQNCPSRAVTTTERLLARLRRVKRDENWLAFRQRAHDLLRLKKPSGRARWTP